MAKPKPLKARDQPEAARKIAALCASLPGRWMAKDVKGDMNSLQASIVLRGFEHAGLVKFDKYRRGMGCIYRTVDAESLRAIARGDIPIPFYVKPPWNTGLVDGVPKQDIECAELLKAQGYGEAPEHRPISVEPLKDGELARRVYSWGKLVGERKR